MKLATEGFKKTKNIQALILQWMAKYTAIWMLDDADLEFVEAQRRSAKGEVCYEIFRHSRFSEPAPRSYCLC